MCIDLHVHSMYSDGTLSPAELVELAQRNGLRALALTDHDTVEGVAELQRLAADSELIVLSGVEISTTWRQYTLHLLGYGFDPANEALLAWLLPLQRSREERNTRILEKLKQLGIYISRDEIETISHCGQTGRPHIARLLVEKGVVANFEAAFHFYLGRGKLAWSPRFSYSAAEAIRMIHQAGGRAVLAHPGMIDPEMRAQPRIIHELTQYGLDGLELYYPAHGSTMRKTLRRIASAHKLLLTGGSDFHGVTRPDKQLAGSSPSFCPPCSLLPPLLAPR